MSSRGKFTISSAPPPAPSKRTNYGTGTPLRKAASLTTAVGTMSDTIPGRCAPVRPNTSKSSSHTANLLEPPLPSTTTVFDPIGQVLAKSSIACDNHKKHFFTKIPEPVLLKKSAIKTNQHQQLLGTMGESQIRTTDNSNTYPLTIDARAIRSGSVPLPEIRLQAVPKPKTSIPKRLGRTRSEPCANRNNSYNQISKSERTTFPKVPSQKTCSSAKPGRSISKNQCKVIISSESEVNVESSARCAEGVGLCNYESAAMKTARSELSLLEQKKLQWAQEREELNGLWSPWGRQTDASNNRQSPPMQMHASYPSPTNVVSSSYVANLGIGTSPALDSQSYSECYLPPINPTIAQQPRQKAKVWNAEFQPEDYRYENGPSNPSSVQTQFAPTNHPSSRGGVVHPRKASLPNYTLEGGGGDGYHNNNYHHQQMVLQQHNKLNANGNSPMWVSVDEEALTSGYYSENNNVDGRGGGHSGKEIILKPSSRERSYQEEVSIQKAIAMRGGDQQIISPKVIVHKIYTQNGEVFAESGGDLEGAIRMTISTSGRSEMNSRNDNGGGMRDSNLSPGGNLPRNHAMRSSLPIGVDASTVDAYNEMDRRVKEQWLTELEKQREEQRLRKLMEKEERRPRWGDRGIGVGHFWEPSDSENSHLPAPPQTTRVKVAHSQSDSGPVPQNETYESHPGQSHTPPAWLERGLTRMQSSKSQPSLHDPDYFNDVGNDNVGGVGSSGPGLNVATGRSFNRSAIDLRNVAGMESPIGESPSDKSFVRGQNVPIDPDTFTEREKKRLANQEHLEALKKQIDEKQQKQREEKERQLQEEREQEIRIEKQCDLERKRLEMEKRGKIPVGDMPNCVEESTGMESFQEQVDTTKISTMLERANIGVHDSKEEKDIEIVQRQSMMVVTAAPPEEEGKTTTSSASSSFHHQREARQDQSVMTDTSDNNAFYERTLTPSMQRSRSLNTCRASREFGTQTELSDGSYTSGSGSSCGSGKLSEKTRSHNSLLDKKKDTSSKDEVSKQEKKSEERPRWGSNPVKKQYVKQSEKDPNYMSRMKRRYERLKRMEEERSVRGDTGTESEDVSIPFYRIRQRRNNNDCSPQRRRGIAPMKATPLENVEKVVTTMTGTGRMHQATETSDNNTSNNRNGRLPPAPSTRRTGYSVPCSNLHALKNAKSETQLTKQQSGDILDRNFGSVRGINSLGTSEESSGFSTPFMARRDVGSGSTGSGTTGSGSGVQSPDLAYHHTYQVSKSTREERNYSKITSGRDVHLMHKGRRESIIQIPSTTMEYSSGDNGFIHQRDFDELPIKSSPNKSPLKENANGTIVKVGNNYTENSTTYNNNKEGGYQNKSSNHKKHDQPKPSKASSPKRKPKSPEKVRKVPESKKNFSSSKRSSLEDNNMTNLPDIPQSLRPTSPPVPALLKKMQMGLQPDESGRISSLPTEFPDILAPLPNIPIGTILSPHPSRLSSATSSATGRIDIDIAVSPRSNPEILKLFEAAEERIKQRQISAIMASNNGLPQLDSDSARSRTSFEADIGSISINFEPMVVYAGSGEVVDKPEIGVPTSARLSIRSHSSSPRPPRSSDAAKHEAFIANILNRKEVKDQLSARESELSEKGIIEFSIRLPSTSSGDDMAEDYKDPLLTERRRHTTQWLYGGGQNVPQKQAILTNLSNLKQGITLQQREWKVNHSDSE